MTEAVTVRLPITILAEIVSCAGGLGDAKQSLENLNSEWAVVEKVNVKPAENPDEALQGVRKTRTFKFDTREELVEHMEKSHLDPDIEVIAALKNGIPRNVKVKVQVQFR